MKKYLLIFLIMCTMKGMTQDDVYPVPPQQGLLFITHGTVHIGNGQVINDATIRINNGKIEEVGPSIVVPGDATVIDAKGKQVYPGLILPQTDLGLKEISFMVRGSNDFAELGNWNSNIRSIVAYNTDSKIINTLKTNGILLANVTPFGSLITGSSSVVQLDAWSWEEALYKSDVGMNFFMPSLLNRSRFGDQGTPAADVVKQNLAQIEEVRKFLREARAYLQEAAHAQVNIKFESLDALFKKKQKLYIFCDEVRQLLIAIDFAKEFGIDVVVVNATESWQVADLLKKNNVAVILTSLHALPNMEDDDIDQPFKTPAILQKAGVLFALNDDLDGGRYRNLAFNAGTAASYGLTMEEALQAITLNAAKILGIDDRTGSIEAGKDANIIISEGDILDMRTSIIDHAFIQGRQVSLENKQTQLYERYKHKYGLK